MSICCFVTELVVFPNVNITPSEHYNDRIDTTPQIHHNELLMQIVSRLCSTSYQSDPGCFHTGSLVPRWDQFTDGSFISQAWEQRFERRKWGWNTFERCYCCCCSANSRGHIKKKKTLNTPHFVHCFCFVYLNCFGACFSSFSRWFKKIQKKQKQRYQAEQLCVSLSVRLVLSFSCLSGPKQCKKKKYYILS